MESKFTICEYPDINGMSRGKIFRNGLCQEGATITMFGGWYKFPCTDFVLDGIFTHDFKFERSDDQLPCYAQQLEILNNAVARRNGRAVLPRIFVSPMGENGWYDTREHARRAIADLKDQYSLEISTGSELEFDTGIEDMSEGARFKYTIPSMSIHATLDHPGYKILEECLPYFQAYGIEIENFSKEYDPYQYELAVRHRRNITGADHVYMIRNIIKQRFPTATFLTKARHGQVLMNSAHFNQSLWRGDINKTPELYEKWCNGLLRHMPALLSFYCGNVLDWERLTTNDNLAPSELKWELETRKTCLRVKNNGEYIENRIVTATANPFLTMAASIVAGMDGLKHQDSADEPPMKMPKTLKESLEHLKNNEVLTKFFGQQFIDMYLEVKNAEIENSKKLGFGLGSGDESELLETYRRYV